MKKLRFSLSRLMGAVAIAALGITAYKVDLSDWRVYRLYHEYVIGVVPMACLLVFGLLIAASDVWRWGECHPFLLGFEMAGWAVLFAHASYMATNFENGGRVLDRLYPLTSWFFQSPNLTYTDFDLVAFHTLVLLIPELALAVLGGLATTYLNIVVARRENPVIGPQRPGG